MKASDGPVPRHAPSQPAHCAQALPHVPFHPSTAEGIEIKISDELISQPYVDMTVKLMERFGVKVGWFMRAHAGLVCSIGWAPADRVWVVFVPLGAEGMGWGHARGA